MSQLASGVNRLAEVNAKRMKLEEKDKKALEKRRPKKSSNTRKKWLKSTYE